MFLDSQEIMLMIHDGLLSYEQAVAELDLDLGATDETGDPPNPTTAGS